MSLIQFTNVFLGHKLHELHDAHDGGHLVRGGADVPAAAVHLPRHQQAAAQRARRYTG